MKGMVHFWFSIIILIMTVFSFVWLNQIKESNNTVLELIEQYDTKIKHAQTMRNVVSRRYNLLLSNLLVDDPFEVDERITSFFEIAYDYREARNELHALPMSEEERELHKELDEVSANPQQDNIKAAEMFRAGAPRKEIEKVLISAKANQAELLHLLDRFVDLQKSKDEVAVEYSRQVFNDSVFWISSIGLLIFTISIIISRYVGQAVALKNQQLMDAREDMEIAYKKAEEATVIKSEFLATMSHEIRTPLTAIIGFAETSLFEDQTKEQRQSATQKIIRSGKHLLHIINDILDLSKIEANKLEIEHIELSLFELLSDIESLVRPAAEDKGLGFSINYIFPLPQKIISDPLRIKQILINLCNNAIKFTEKGYVLINVSSDDARAMSTLKFEVIDSGIGIAKDKQEAIFKAYQQADRSTTRKFGGTGLGLSLSNKLAGFLGGELTVTSEEYKGSKFIFSLSYEYVLGAEMVFNKEHVPNVYEMSERVKSSGYLSGKVLLAEDNKDNQELILLYLDRMGIDLTVVDNGQLAVDAVRENNFDAVLMDMQMPVMGGLEAAKLLRKEGFDKAIIALTANAMKEDKKACLDAGCNDFLSKPIDANKLSETLEKYLSKGVNCRDKRENEVDVLVSLLAGDGQKTMDLIKKYVGNLSNTLEQIEHSIQEQDWDNLSEQLHQLKGTAGNFGYPIVSSLAEIMEVHTADKNKDDLVLDFIELRSTYQKIVLGLDDSTSAA